MKGGSNQLISAEETAGLLAVHKDTLYKSWRDWGLKGYRVGKALKFKERDIDTYLERHKA
jgi:excisionase family DNA binding protein